MPDHDHRTDQDRRRTTEDATPSVRPPGPNDGPLFTSVWRRLHARPTAG